MAIEIVDFPINSMVIFHGKMLVHQGGKLDLSTISTSYIRWRSLNNIEYLYELGESPDDQLY